MKKIIETNEMFRKAIDGKEELEGYLIKGITITSKDFGEDIPCEEWCRKYNNVVFHNVTFEGIKFYNFLLFDNCMFINSVFNNGIMSYTKFKSCQIEGTIFQNIEFEFSEFIHSNLFLVEYKKCNFEMRDRFTNCHCLPRDRFFFNKCTFPEHLFMQSSKIPLENLVSNKEDLKKIIFDICDSSLFDHPLVNVGPIGSRKKFTVYIPHIDWVQCGCWTDDQDDPDPHIFCGGHLDAFEKRVQNVYPEGKYHDQYMAAIKIFETARKKFLGQAVAV